MSTASEINEPTNDSVVADSAQAVHNNDICSADTGEAQGSPELAHEIPRGPAPELAENSNYSIPLEQTSSPSPLDVVSPRPSLHIPSKIFMSVTVEDCFDDEDGRAQHDPVDTPPSSFCVTTPPIKEAPEDPQASDKEVVSVKSQVHMQESINEQPQHQVGCPDVPTPQDSHLKPLQRRPSVMDYLVSQDSAKSSASASEASGPAYRRNVDVYAWWDHGPGLGSGGQAGTNGQPNVFGGPHGDDKRPQASWNGHQPAFQSVDNPLSIQGNFAARVPYGDGYSHSYDHSAAAAPRSNVSVPPSDLRTDQHPATFHPELSTTLESMAPSGYQLLAAKLSGDAGGPPLTPIYRRFDALNHRLLLYMQDEIADLERQLISLEANDTLKRSYAGGVVPASRRQDRWIGGSLEDQKTEVLGHIGYKLSQYNQVLASFRTVQDLPVPTWRDIQSYKTYLTTSKLIIDDETRFLDMANDLVSLAMPNQSTDDFNTMNDGPTPMPKASEESQFPTLLKDSGSSSSTQAEQAQAQIQQSSDILFARLALLGMCTIFVPIITFAIVPSFVARMAIVLLVTLSMVIMVEQAGFMPDMKRHKLDWVLFSGLYCGAMAVVAGAVE